MTETDSNALRALVEELRPAFALAKELLAFMDKAHNGQPTCTLDAGEARTVLDALSRVDALLATGGDHG